MSARPQHCLDSLLRDLVLQGGASPYLRVVDIDHPGTDRSGLSALLPAELGSKIQQVVFGIRYCGFQRATA